MSLFYSASMNGFYDDTIHTNEQIPSDAVPITEEMHQELLTAQSECKQITADATGNPVATDRPAPTIDELAIIAISKRDQLLAETDYLVIPDYPITAEKLALVKTCRQLLRDITEQAGFPTEIDWPQMPT